MAFCASPSLGPLPARPPARPSLPVLEGTAGALPARSGRRILSLYPWRKQSPILQDPGCARVLTPISLPT